MHELFAEVRRQLQILSRYVDQVKRIMRVIVAFFLALLILVMRELLTVAEYAEPYVRKIARTTRSGLITTRRKTMAVARTLKQKEKELEPKAIEAAHKFEEAVIVTAIKAVPPAKKAMWGIWRILFVTWVAGTTAILLIVALSE